MEAINNAVEQLQIIEPKKIDEELLVSRDNVPKKLEDRKVTDKYFTYAFFYCLALLVSLMAYGLFFSFDTRLDSDESFLEHFSKYFFVSKTIVLKCILTLTIMTGVTFVVLFLIRYIPYKILRTSTYFVILLINIALWILSSFMIRKAPYVCIVGSVGVIQTIWFFTNIMLLHARLKFIPKLLKEAVKTIFAVHWIGWALPLLMFSLFMGTVALWFVLTKLFTASGIPTNMADIYKMFHELSPLMIVTILFNTLVTMWSLSFVSGLHYMLLSSLVSHWYFTDDKNTCKPFRKAFLTTKRHIGTLFLGSIILPLTTPVRIIIKFLIPCAEERKPLNRRCGIIDFINHANRRAYAMTALHGYPFLEAGKKARELLSTKFCEALAVQYNIKFVLICMTLLISSICASISPLIYAWETEEKLIPIEVIYVFFLALIYAIMYFSAVQTVIDTLCICTCQDKIINDPTDTHYFMTEEWLKVQYNIWYTVGYEKAWNAFYAGQLKSPTLVFPYMDEEIR